jgi:hypothetical protein
MSGAIRVDKAALDDQLTKLAALINDKELQDYCGKYIVPELNTSSGNYHLILSDINTELNNIVSEFYFLMSRTLDFLSNTGTSFIETDEDLAEEIRRNSN